MRCFCARMGSPTCRTPRSSRVYSPSWSDTTQAAMSIWRRCWTISGCVYWSACSSSWIPSISSPRTIWNASESTWSSLSPLETFPRSWSLRLHERSSPPAPSSRASWLDGKWLTGFLRWAKVVLTALSDWTVLVILWEKNETCSIWEYELHSV